MCIRNILFNANESQLPCFDVWRQHGWQSAQTLAWQLWGQEPQATCKGSTSPDMIWLSPEAAALCSKVFVTQTFAEHATIGITLEVPLKMPELRTWPLPSRIPWHEVPAEWAANATMPEWKTTGSADQLWGQLGRALESSLNGNVPSQPGLSLQKTQLGRLQRHAPLKCSGNTMMKPSRPSEVQLRNDLIGAPVRKWFKQLRRLQSYLASIATGNTSAGAVSYRLQLWTSILQANGFKHGFPLWWIYHRAHGLEDTPPELPSSPPALSAATAIFHTFKLCFEKFESWHLRQRCKLLKQRYEKGMRGLFQDLRQPRQDTLDFLHESHDYEVLAVDDSKQQIHLDDRIPDAGVAHWSSNGKPIVVTKIEEVLMHTAEPTDCETGDVVTQHVVHADLDHLHEAVVDFWKQTWCDDTPAVPELWARFQGFCRAYITPIQFDIQPITLAQWKRTVARFKATAARGVDGISHLDLLHAPDQWTLRLLDLLNRIELGELTWPSSILFGVVQLLAKEPGASTVARFRPIVVFSTIYRAWASLRARQLLRQFRQHIAQGAYGFLPGCEPSQVWLPLQADIELALREGRAKCGLSTDLVRAFNFISREHTYFLAECLGVPSRIMVPWKRFLADCKRAFRIRGCLSQSCSSVRGMPEGDALSVYAMVQLDHSWHLYMKQFCPTIQTFSFVDNLTLTAAHVFYLAQGLACLRSFFNLWGMRLDEGKSYSWSTDPQQRKLLGILGFQSVHRARELGGSCGAETGFSANCFLVWWPLRDLWLLLWRGSL